MTSIVCGQRRRVAQPPDIPAIPNFYRVLRCFALSLAPMAHPPVRNLARLARRLFDGHDFGTYPRLQIAFCSGKRDYVHVACPYKGVLGDRVMCRSCIRRQRRRRATRTGIVCVLHGRTRHGYTGPRAFGSRATTRRPPDRPDFNGS